MTLNELLLSLLLSASTLFIVYRHCGFENIKQTYMMWFNKEYWTDYNKVEAAAWFAKACIIIPGLIFGVQIWWFYIIAMLTSLSLIWASNRKLLPSLIAFNTIWVWLAAAAISKHLV